MFVRCLSLVLALLLTWSGLAFHEVLAQGSSPGAAQAAVPSAGSVPDDTAGSVGDHHLDDAGASVHDLPDQHAPVGAILLAAILLPHVVHGAVVALCSPDLPGPHRPPRKPPLSA